MAILEKVGAEIGLSQIIVNIIVSAAVFILGIILAQVVFWILRRALNNARIDKAHSYSFLRRFITVIKWSIYLLFLNLALKVLGVPQFTNWLTDILIVIPALVGGLLLIGAGFVISIYLKEAIDESKLEGKEVLSKICYYFVLYVFMAFALKTALLSLDSMTSNIIVIILTAVVGVSVGFHEVGVSRKKK